MPNRKRDQPPIDETADIRNWITPEQFECEFPLIATAQAIRRDIWRRKALRLEEYGAIRQVGRRFLIHRVKFAEWRLQQHKPPSE